MLDRYRLKAEAELARAQQADDDDLRRRLFLRAGILFNLASGGERRMKSPQGFTY